MLNAHIAECVRWGVTPLSEDVLATMEVMGYSLDDAFSVASDLYCGFSWEEALTALR